MKNVKFRGKKTNSAVKNSAAQIPRKNSKSAEFRGRGKLWALVVTLLDSK